MCRYFSKGNIFFLNEQEYREGARAAYYYVAPQQRPELASSLVSSVRRIAGQHSNGNSITDMDTPVLSQTFCTVLSSFHYETATRCIRSDVPRPEYTGIWQDQAKTSVLLCCREEEMGSQSVVLEFDKLQLAFKF